MPLAIPNPFSPPAPPRPPADRGQTVQGEATSPPPEALNRGMHDPEWVRHELLRSMSHLGR